MKLITFDAQTLPVSINQNGRLPKASFSKRGTIEFNELAFQLMELNDGDKIAFAQQDDVPENWYFYKSKTGFPVKKRKNKPFMVLYHKTLVQTFKDAFALDLDATAVFEIDKEPVEEDGLQCWKLIIETE